MGGNGKTNQCHMKLVMLKAFLESQPSATSARSESAVKGEKSLIYSKGQSLWAGCIQASQRVFLIAQGWFLPEAEDGSCQMESDSPRCALVIYRHAEGLQQPRRSRIT